MTITSECSENKLVDMLIHDAYHWFLIYFENLRRSIADSRLIPCVAQGSGVLCQEI